tara:strand:- start:67 stop:423 length:357 start_codon:yes stop_codon:yes gene_type:complete
MPVAEKEIELDDGSKILVKQASGRKKLKIEALQAKVFRQFRDKGDPTDWDMSVHEEFSDALDEAGAGIEAQVEAWLPGCIITEGVDLDDLTSQEIMRVLNWVRGDTEEASIPLDSSQE